MSDYQGKLLDDLGDLDWDSALDDWEKKAFVPQVASEAETNKVEPPLENAEASPRDAHRPGDARPGAPAAGAAQGSLKDVSSEGTVIAPVPRELRADPRRGPSVPPLASPPPRGSTAPSPSASTAPGTGRGAAARECRPPRGSGTGERDGQDAATSTPRQNAT